MSDEKKTPGLTRRGLVGLLRAAAATSVIGGPLAIVELATRPSLKELQLRQEREQMHNLITALNKNAGTVKPGEEWKPYKFYGWVQREVADGNLKHTQLLYNSGGLVKYSLTTVSDKPRVETQLVYDDKIRRPVLPKETSLEPEDRKVIEALMNAETNMLSSKTRSHTFDYIRDVGKEMKVDVGVPMSASFQDGAIIFRTHPEDRSKPGVDYIYVHKDNKGYGITPKWIVRSGEISDGGFVTRKGQIVGSEDSRTWNSASWQEDYKKIGTHRKIPAVTGEPSGDLRKDMQEKAAIFNEHIKPGPAKRQSGVILQPPGM